MFCNLVIDAIYNKILSRLHKMHMLSFSLTLSTHLTISHSLSSAPSAPLSLHICVILSKTLLSALCMREQQQDEQPRGVEGREREGTSLDQWQWPSAWERGAERAGRGCLCLLCMKFTWICFKFACLAYYCHTCCEYPHSPPSPLFLTCNKL